MRLTSAMFVANLARSDSAGIPPAMVCNGGGKRLQPANLPDKPGAPATGSGSDNPSLALRACLKSANRRKLLSPSPATVAISRSESIFHRPNSAEQEVAMRGRTWAVRGVAGALALLCAAGGAVGQTPGTGDGKAAAIVNGETISLKQLESALKQQGPMAVPL